MQPSMTVSVNGQAVSLPEGASLEDLIHLLNKDPVHVATAVNETFVPRTQRSAVRLCQGDAIMTFEPITGG